MFKFGPTESAVFFFCFVFSYRFTFFSPGSPMSSVGSVSLFSSQFRRRNLSLKPWRRQWETSSLSLPMAINVFICIKYVMGWGEQKNIVTKKEKKTAVEFVRKRSYFWKMMYLIGPVDQLVRKWEFLVITKFSLQNI